MRTGVLLIALVALSCVVTTEALSTGLVLAGLGALKIAAIVGRAGRRRGGHRHYHHRPRYHHHHHKRSIESEVQADENMLLSTVGQMDPNGCILKLLCNLQVKDEATRTFEEDVLVEMFSNATETVTSFNAAFVGAVDVGGKTHDLAVCQKSYPKCPLNDAQLSGLLHMAWGCPDVLVGEEEAVVA